MYTFIMFFFKLKKTDKNKYNFLVRHEITEEEDAKKKKENVDFSMF